MSEPQIGDVIRSAVAVGVDRDVSPQWLYVRLDTAESVARALELIASGRWVLVERRAENERPDANR